MTATSCRLRTISLPVLVAVATVAGFSRNKFTRRSRRGEHAGDGVPRFTIHELRFTQRPALRSPRSTSCSKTRTTSSEPAPRPAQWAGRMPESETTPRSHRRPRHCRPCAASAQLKTSRTRDDAGNVTARHFSCTKKNTHCDASPRCPLRTESAIRRPHGLVWSTHRALTI